MNWLIYIFNRFFVNSALGAPRSSDWDRVRSEHIRRHPECAVCKKVGKIISNDVHHILPFWRYPEFELLADNLVTLCRKHHFEWGHFFDWKSYNEEIKRWIRSVENKP